MNPSVIYAKPFYSVQPIHRSYSTILQDGSTVALDGIVFRNDSAAGVVFSQAFRCSLLWPMSYGHSKNNWTVTLSKFRPSVKHFTGDGCFYL